VADRDGLVEANGEGTTQGEKRTLSQQNRILSKAPSESIEKAWLGAEYNKHYNERGGKTMYRTAADVRGSRDGPPKLLEGSWEP